MKLPIKSLLVFLLFAVSSFSLTTRKKVNIVFLGDSITEGSALLNPLKDAPPVFAGNLLRTKKSFSAVQIANNGYSGHTTLDFLPATNKDFPLVMASANAFAQDTEATLLFSIMLGTNDSAIFGPNGSPVSPADYKKNMQVIIDNLLHEFPQAKIIIQYPIWYSPNTHNGARYLQEGLDRLESYYPQLDELVREYNSAYPQRVYAGSKSGFDYFRKKKEALLIPEKGNSGTFYLHPNEKGSEELAKIWVKGIEKAIKD